MRAAELCPATDPTTPSSNTALLMLRATMATRKSPSARCQRSRRFRARTHPFDQGNLPVEDLSRFIFALKEIRGTVEAGQTIDHIAGKAGPYVSQINVIGIPRGWLVVGLLGAEAHLPAETAHRLREL